ncbi:MAG: hypothetical protein KC458_07415 [Dehalococcoidia bacterium]|nr:hypothetical protein [Dehalococcoidia bacterium]MCB9484160.1 hypothetical protein [Dehalococcoidia bacterium]MCB9491160.1 hypothetical protein [Dehalococcoidia bacterium]
METVPPEGLRVLWTREQIADGVEAIAEELVTTYGDAPTVNLVPVMTGGLHFAAALSSALERRAPGKWLISPVFAAAYVADGDVTTPSIEFPAGFEGRVDAAAPVVVVDDLLDSGTTMAALVSLLSERSAGPVRVAVLIERDREREVFPHADFCAFHVHEDDWLVGFGMDTGRRFRGLDAVYVRDTGDEG